MHYQDTGFDYFVTIYQLGKRQYEHGEISAKQLAERLVPFWKDKEVVNRSGRMTIALSNALDILSDPDLVSTVDDVVANILTMIDAEIDSTQSS